MLKKLGGLRVGPSKWKIQGEDTLKMTKEKGEGE